MNCSVMPGVSHQSRHWVFSLFLHNHGWGITFSEFFFILEKMSILAKIVLSGRSKSRWVFLKNARFVNWLHGKNVAFSFLHFRFFESQIGAWSHTSHDRPGFMPLNDLHFFTKKELFSEVGSEEHKVLGWIIALFFCLRMNRGKIGNLSRLGKSPILENLFILGRKIRDRFVFEKSNFDSYIPVR